MQTSNYLFLVVLLTAAGVMARSVWRLNKYLSFAKADNRWDRPYDRVIHTIKVAIFQSKILRDKAAGPIHALIFWGFLILLTAAAEAVLEGIHPALGIAFLGPIYTAFSVLVDFFCAFIIVGVVMSLWRRYITKVKRLQVAHEKVEAGMILLTIFGIVTALLLQNAGKIAMGVDSHWAVRPISSMLAHSVMSGWSASTTECVFQCAWWTHIILILVFTNYLPYSKHLHVLTSVPNVFFSPLEYPNHLDRIDFETESDIVKFGVSDIEDFSWKTLFDGYTCTHCGRCTSVCPANQTGKVLDPREVIVQINHRTMDKGPLLVKLQDVADNTSRADMQDAALRIIRGKAVAEFDDVERGIFESTLNESERELWSKKLIGDYVSADALWACTTCGACMQECPVNIEHVPAIVGMRRSMVMMESSFNHEAELLPDIFSNIENNGVPWGGMAADDRAAWTEGMDIKTAAEDAEMDVLFWVGCAGSYDERAKKISRAFATLMQMANVRFRILGNEERCSGDPARRGGNEYLADAMTKMNIETMAGYNVRNIVTTCPHCFNTLSNEYPQFGGNYHVQHHTQFIRDLIESGRLSIDRTNPAISSDVVAYHDSCYLGRYNQEFEAPRALLENVPGLQLASVKRSEDRGFCCGAGGARMFMEETVGERVNINRTNELLATGATTVAVNCPFCTTMITDGVKASDKIDTVVVKDVSEILLEALQARS